MEKATSFNIIGSVIPSDIVKFSGLNYQVKKFFLSISPCSFLNLTNNSILNLPIVNTESYLSDLNKTIFSELAKNKSDFVLIDLLDCRLNVQKIKFENSNEIYTVTLNNGLKEVLKDKRYEIIEEISPTKLSELEWHNILKKYIKELLKIYKSEQIIVIENKMTSFYISNSNFLYNFSNSKEIETNNRFFSMLYSNFRMIAPKIKFISCPSTIYCDEQLGKPFPFRISSEYYAYAASALKAISENDKTVDIALLCKECSEKSLERVQKSKKQWQDIELKNFCGIYKDDFANFIDTGGNKIDVYLKGAKNNVKIASQCTIKTLRLTLCSNNILSIGEKTQIGVNCVINIGSNCVLTIKDSVNLLNNITIKEEFDSIVEIGKFSILYSNLSIDIRKKSIFKIGENNKLPLNSQIIIFHDTKLQMGNFNEITSDCLLVCSSYTEIIFKNDCLLSSFIRLINGDGHSIFDVETGRKLNDMKAAPKDKRSIILNNHVWVGRGAYLLNGTNIGEGSIVGAQSLVKKTFPNNCIIAGSPAKIIRRNICWSRNNDIENINSCEPYINMTNDL